ncbi:M13 family metallopeptidase [Bythopirellula goksoeyrii]|uniref:Neutral endopeptidase n=1 Tax=Bythopirellula goksoeyrii TaxID=1400387 RepID=A0A5B9QDC7_9BACT|nr:M13 family metallopeptidase [Bythopirellula goksoeyrii]QEG35630.1 Neutral endopeptidase [Bythopirellula goksoeyrii]
MSRMAIVAFSLFAFIPYTFAAELKSGLDRKAIDPSVRVQDNPFLYMNGNWLKHTPIPADKSNYGSFSLLEDEAQLAIKEICEQAAESDHPKGSLEQKIGDFYTSYMDEATIAKHGIGSLQSELDAIDHVKSYDELIELFGHFNQIGVETPFGFFVDQDDKDSTRYLAALIQSGTTLPDRDYYLEESEENLAARAALVKYINTLFELSDLPHEKNVGTQILDLETALAKLQWTKTELRDAHKRYNKHTIAELVELSPSLPWESFFDSASVEGVEELNVCTPSFFEELDALIGNTPLDVWKEYLRFHLLDAFASALPAPYVDAQFALYGKQLGGTPELEPRWKRAVDAISGKRGFGVLGDAAGQLYVKKNFPHRAKERMDDLVGNLMKAYEQSIDDLEWMTPVTKEKAKEKLAKITTKIGHTDKWRDYSALVIEPDDLLGNYLRSAEVEYNRMIDKLGKPVDKEEWFMTPQTVNAYYNPGQNEIVFPAAILQPPFFDVDAHDAVNYGGIGAIIGHEISHAFDDQGSKYDGDGNLNNWWTDEDRAAFHKLTSKLVDQFNSYSPLPSKHVNGKLTLGENIADLSGMSIAYKAYNLFLDGEEAPIIDDWTGDQRFFLGWSQSWQRKYRDAEMLKRLLVDPHSPSMYRSNGPMSNFDPFYEAFEVKLGDEQYRAPEDRIRIW